MRKFKKVFAFVTALALSASAFAGLTVTTASAADLPATIKYDSEKIIVTSSAAQTGAKLIVAKHANNKLTGLAAENIDLVAGDKEVTKSLEKNDQIMVWKSLSGDGGMEPLAPTYTVTGDELPEGVNIYPNQTVDLSSIGTLDENSGYYVVPLANAWKKLDLTPYTKKTNAETNSPEQTTKIVITYKEIIQLADSRSNIGFYDEDTAKYATPGWQEIDGSSIVYGILGNQNKRVYVNGVGANGNGTFTTDSEQEVALTYDMLNNTVSGHIGPHNIATTTLTLADSVDTFALRGWVANDYKIKDMKITTYTSKDLYHNVEFNVDGTKTTKSVKDGESVKATDIPDTTKKGFVFDGWLVDDATENPIDNDALKALTITADKTFTAAYHQDAEYKEIIEKIEFVSPATVAVTEYPTEDGAIENKPYTVKVTSDIGNDISDDCTFEWTIVGKSADSYVDLNNEDEDKTGKTRNLYIRQGGENCYGYIKATATYTKNSEADPKDVQIPFAVITKTKPENQILPLAGYPVSMDDYKDDIIGYKATAQDRDAYDIVLNNWGIVGSLATRDLLLVQEDGKKALKFTNTGGTRGGTGSSVLGAAAFGSITDQYVVEMIAKFSENSNIGVHSNTTNNSHETEWAITYKDGKLSAYTKGDAPEPINGLDTETWYKVIIANNPETHTYSTYVYDETGTTLKGKMENVAGDATTVKYICIDTGYPFYLNSFRTYLPTVSNLTINSATNSVQVPAEEGAAANELALTASAKTSDDILLTGAVTFSLDQEYNGVELVKNGAQGATLKVSNGAAGTVKVNATMGTVTTSKEITLINSADVVSFTTSKSSITIPFAGKPDETAVYEAKTISHETGQPLDKAITYSYLKKNGTEALENLPSGVTASEAGGKLTLTVAPGATPAIFYILATDEDGLSTKTQVNVHGLSYSFGTEEVEGQTQVTATTLYSDTLGYGFESTTGLAGTATAVGNATAAYKFKAKVGNGNYAVTVDTTSSSMQSEIVDAAVAINANVTGITKSAASFNVAVCDEVLDLTFAANSTVTSLSIAQITEPEEREKPKVYAIGDSTTANADAYGSKSWGNCVGAEVTLPDAFSAFSNNGMAGRDSVNFYNQARVEAVLLDVHPGDYVTVNMGINSRTESGNEGGAYPILMDTYYVKAIMERGAIPVIVTATPIGPRDGIWNNNAGNYNATTQIFDVNRGDAARNDELRKLAKKYDLNIIELGYAGEAMFNALDVAAYNTANGTTFDNRGDIVKTWYTDHNHYKPYLGTWIGNYILNCLVEIDESAQKDAYNWTKDTHISQD